DLCADIVQRSDVYVGVLGTRYGSPVSDKPEVSYTELEFDTATEAKLPRLVFVLDTNADNVGIPVSALIDERFGARQAAFRARVRSAPGVKAGWSPSRSLTRPRWGSWWNARCENWPNSAAARAAKTCAGRL